MALNVPVKAVLTDNGREFCGRPGNHPYELFLQLHDIEHRTTRVRSPRTNDFVERMNGTFLDESFRVLGRTTWYISLGENQRDLDPCAMPPAVNAFHPSSRRRKVHPKKPLPDQLLEIATVGGLLNLYNMARTS